jgi:hypothetical protein
MMTSILALLLMVGAPLQEVKALIDNNRVMVRELTFSGGKPAPIDKRTNDVVVIDLTKTTAFFVPKGGKHDMPGHAIQIDLKDVSIPPVPNKTPYPLAFPREGVKKILENDRVIIWDYTWTIGKPTVMHFHDKDVVVVYLAEGQLKSTTPDGKSEVNNLSPGLTRFNAPNRSHSEELVSGSSRAIITEFK